MSDFLSVLLLYLVHLDSSPWSSSLHGSPVYFLLSNYWPFSSLLNQSGVLGDTSSHSLFKYPARGFIILITESYSIVNKHHIFLIHQMMNPGVDWMPWQGWVVPCLTLRCKCLFDTLVSFPLEVDSIDRIAPLHCQLDGICNYHGDTFSRLG